MVDCVVKQMQWSPGKIPGSLVFPLHHSIARGERCGAWDRDCGCFLVKPWHSLVAKRGSSLYIMKMGSWKPTRGFVHVVTVVISTRSLLLPNEVTHRPLAVGKGQYNHPTTHNVSRFLTLLNSNQSLNWVKNNHTEQKKMISYLPALVTPSPPL